MSTYVEYVDFPDQQTCLGAYLAIDTGEHEETGGRAGARVPFARDRDQEMWLGLAVLYILALKGQSEDLQADVLG